MYRSSIALLFLALISLFSLPAAAQYSRESAASKKIDEAINEHYLATDFDKAESVLTGTVKACEDKCSPGLLAKAWMYVGIVRGSGKNDQKGAADAFGKALAIDPAVKLDTQLATPDTQKTFAATGGGGGGDETPAPKGKKDKEPAAAPAGGAAAGMNCTPDVKEMQTRRPVPVQCSTDEEAASMDLRYKSFGGEWKTVKMKKSGDTFRGQVPCDATNNAGTLKLYVTAKDASGEKVDNWGSKSEPNAIEATETSQAEPPTYDGEEAPARCQAKGECPPDFPGCSDKHSSKRGSKDWGAQCDNSPECKEGLLCEGGTCETAPSCETAADCSTGICTDGKCSVAGDDDGGTAGPYKKNWFGLHFAQDWAFVGGSDVCQSQNRAQFACYESGSTDTSYTNDPQVGANIATGAVFATHRILLSYDRAFTPNITAGARAGFAFGGGPPAGKDDTTAGTAFLPFHFEARLSYWFGKGALGKKGLRPYVHVGGGIAQVDAKVPVTVNDCGPAGSKPTCVDASVPANTGPEVQLDAWRKMGQAFVVGGGGAVWAFTPKVGLQLNANFMYMLGSSGLVIEPSLGVVMGM